MYAGRQNMAEISKYVNPHKAVTAAVSLAVVLSVSAGAAAFGNKTVIRAAGASNVPVYDNLISNKVARSGTNPPANKKCLWLNTGSTYTLNGHTVRKGETAYYDGRDWISTNSTVTEELTGSINSNRRSIDSNTQSISSNTGSISNNRKSIDANSKSIGDNTNSISNNKKSIDSNSKRITSIENNRATFTLTDNGDGTYHLAITDPLGK